VKEQVDALGEYPNLRKATDAEILAYVNNRNKRKLEPIVDFFPGFSPSIRGAFDHIALIGAPQLGEVRFRAYFLGVFPLRSVKTGYGLFICPENSRFAGIYLEANGPRQSRCYFYFNDNIVHFIEETDYVQLQYVHTNALDWSVGSLPSREGFTMFLPLYRDMPPEFALQLPTKIYFPRKDNTP